MTFDEKTGLQLAAKMIAATNIAVAEAIWKTYYLQQSGQPTMPVDELVLRDVRQAMKRLDELEAEA